MVKITITGAARWNGEWELDTADRPFTNGEWRVLKQVASVLPLQLNEALLNEDKDAMLALALIALMRNGQVTREQLDAAEQILLEASGDAINWQQQEEPQELPADPPMAAADGGPTSGSDEKPVSSGVTSNGGSDSPADGLPATGPAGSDTGAT